MPDASFLTDEERGRLVQSRGLDPGKFTVDNTGFVIPRPLAPVPSSPPPAPDAPGLLDSARRSATEALIPTLAGLGAGAYAASIPASGGITALALPIVAAIAGGAGASYLQEQVVPDEVKQALFTREFDIQENPLTTAASGFIPSALAFSPTKSIQQVPTLMRGLGKMITKGPRAGATALEATEVLSLANAGINLGVQTGQAGAMELMDDRPFDLARFAAETLPAALLSEPGRLGKKVFGFRGTEDFAGQLPFSREEPQVTRITPEETRAREEGFRRAETERVERLRKAEDAVTKVSKEQSAEAEVTKQAFLKGDLITPEQVEGSLTEQRLAQPEQQPTAAERQRAGLKQAQRQRADETVREHELRAAEESGLAIEEEFTRGIRRAEEGEQLPVISKGSDLLKRRVAKTQEQIAKLQRSTEDTTPISNLPSDIDQAIRERGLRKAAEERGLKVEIVDQLTDTQTGKPQLNRRGKPLQGQYDPNTNTITLSAAAVAETPYHETAHGYIRDLMLSSRPQDRKLVARLKEIFADHPISPEEGAAEILGVEGVNRALIREAGTVSQKIKDFVADALANAKDAFGLASEEDVVRMFAARQEFDAPYGTRIELLPSAALPKNAPAIIERTEKTPTKTGLKTNEKKTDKVKGKETQATQGERTLADVKGAGELVKFGGREYRVVEAEGGNQFRLRDVKTGKERDVQLAPRTSEEEARTLATQEEVANAEQGEILRYAEEGAQVLSQADSKASWTKALDATLTNPNLRKTEITTSPDPVLRIVGSAVDKVRNLGTAGIDYVADTLDTHALARSKYQGKYVNALQFKAIEFSPKVRERVDKFGRDMMLTKGEQSSVRLTPEEQKLYDITRNYLKEIADENTIREIEKNEHYWPPMLSLKVVDVWKNHPNSPEGLRYRKLWLDHAIKETDTNPADVQAVRALEKQRDAIIKSIGEDDQGSIEFGPLRKEAGFGLPEELQDNNYMSRFMRYGLRVSKDKAFFDYLQNDPVMRYVLEIPDKFGMMRPKNPPKLKDGTVVDGSIRGTEQIHNLKKFIFGDFAEVNQPILQSVMRMVNSALLGTGTGIRNIANAPLLALKNINRLENIPAVFTALFKMRSVYRRALETNALQLSINELGPSSVVSPNVWAQRFNYAADFLRKYSLRDWSERMERNYEFAVGETIALGEIGRAKRGDKKAIEWVRKFGTLIKDLNTRVLDPKGKMSDITVDDLNNISKSFTDRTAGSFDERGQPLWAITGKLSPFFALSRWTLEQTNLVWKDVVKPAMDGKPLNLLAYTLGAVFTGEAIEKINELLNQSRPYQPTVREAFSTDNNLQQARSVIALMQLAAYGGLVSDVMKASTDLYGGHVPRGISFPLMDFLGTTVAKGTADYATALNAGEDPFTATKAFVEHLLTRSIQSVRLASNLTWRKDDQARKEKFRDIRIFKELEGDPAMSIPPSTNPFLDLDIKEFKRSENFQEAAEMVPGLVKKKIEQARLPSGELDVEEVRRGLRGLRQNSFQTIPNPEDNPREAFRYLEFLKETQGEEAASERLRDFMRQRELNKAKSKLVPSL